MKKINKMKDIYVPTGLRTSDIIHRLNEEDSKRYFELKTRQLREEQLSEEEKNELKVLDEKQNECGRKMIEDDGERTEGELS